MIFRDQFGHLRAIPDREVYGGYGAPPGFGEAQVVYDGFGNPLGAFPFLAALAPFAAKLLPAVTKILPGILSPPTQPQPVAPPPASPMPPPAATAPEPLPTITQVPMPTPLLPPSFAPSPMPRGGQQPIFIRRRRRLRRRVPMRVRVERMREEVRMPPPTRGPIAPASADASQQAPPLVDAPPPATDLSGYGRYGPFHGFT